jgi:hypothetical protein
MDMRIPNDRHIRIPVLRPAARIAFAAVMLFGPAILSFGQSLPPRVLRGFSLGGFFPVGAFDEHVRQIGPAVGFYLAIRAGNSPAFIGAELSGGDYGHAHRHEYLEEIPEVRLDVDTTNSIGQGLLFVRLQPAIGYVMPYVEGLAGLSYLFTETTISGHEYPYDEVGSDINFHSLTVTAGAEAGLCIRLTKMRTRDPDHGWGAASSISRSDTWWAAGPLTSKKGLGRQQGTTLLFPRPVRDKLHHGPSRSFVVLLGASWCHNSRNPL